MSQANPVPAPARSSRPSSARSSRIVLLVWAAGAMLSIGTSLPQLDRLGLYYDEAFMAQQARDFVEPERQPVHPGSVRSIEIAGRSFPLRNAAYLGSVKSQLLIPFLAVFGSSITVLRVATLFTALLAVLFVMLFAQEVSGRVAAVAVGALLATDPCLHLLGLYEWGPFTTNLLARSLALFLLAWGYRSESRLAGILAFGGAGIALGLGIFSRVDFAVIIVAAGLGLLAARPRIIAELWRERRAEVVTFAAGGLLFSATMIAEAGALLTTSGEIADRGGLDYKISVLWSTLDGSHMLRLLRVGGLFDSMFDGPAPYGFFGGVLPIGAVALSLALFRRSSDRRDALAAADAPWFRFLLVTSAILTAGMLAMPGAVRGHHQLNSMPFYQLLVVAAGIFVWRMADSRAAPSRRLVRGLVMLLAAATIAGNLAMISHVRDEIAASGGRGRWTSELTSFAARVDREPDAVVTSLDWGFHEPLAFLTNRATLEEPIWAIVREIGAGRAWGHQGSAKSVYLVHGRTYDLFGLGPKFLEAVRALPRDQARIEVHRDGVGDIAFYSVRFGRPHSITYDGRFRIRLHAG